MKGKTPSLITGSSGKPKPAVCKKRSICKRCKGEISASERCFEIPIVGRGYTASKRHCEQCFKEILEQTRKDLESFEELFK